jgi:hypothetical protein
MPKPLNPPLSPTVATVFDNFLERLQAEKICDEATIKNLRKVLEDQKLDAESLRGALIKAGPAQT